MNALATSLLCALAAWTKKPSPAIGTALHDGPPVYLEFAITEGNVELRLQGEQPALNPWLGFPVEKLHDEVPLPEPEAPLYVGGLERFLAENCPLTLNGERTTPKIESVELAEAFGGGYGAPIVVFKLNYACDGWPRTIGIVWDRFDGLKGLEGAYLPGIFRWEGDFIHVSLSPEEPEFTWHATPELGRKREVRAVTTPERSEEIPLGSALIIAALALSIPFTRRFKPPFLAVALIWSGGIAGAWALRDAKVASPFRGRVDIPTEAEAIAMFEQLHANIYEAFGASSEDGIYDLLAKSVAPEMLDELYGEIYESLIMRGEGGAVADVQKIEVFERAVEMPDPSQADPELPPHFDVDWKWKVDGLVSHWGHTHSRTNQYRAEYRVAHDGASWKIAAVNITEYERIEDYGGFNR